MAVGAAPLTTPEERRRNLGWGREALEELSLDPDLPADWRNAAASALADYPTQEFMRQFDAADPDALDDYASALLKARLLFHRVQAGSGCSAQRRYMLAVVLRHFPWGDNALQETGKLVALDSFVQALDECLKRRAARVCPQGQLEDVDAPSPRFAAADDVLANLQALRQLHLAQASIGPEDVQLLKEQLVLLTVERASHPDLAANATGQDQREEELWENAIINIEVPHLRNRLASTMT